MYFLTFRTKKKQGHRFCEVVFEKHEDIVKEFSIWVFNETDKITEKYKTAVITNIKLIK